MIKPCTCSDHQLREVGCDCGHERELHELNSAAYLEYLMSGAEDGVNEDAAPPAPFDPEAQYDLERHNEEFPCGYFADPREDFAEFTLAAARHQ